MTLNEIKDKTPPERTKLYRELKEEYFHLKMKKSSGQLEKNHRLGEVRKDMARLLTLERLDRKEK